MEGKDDALMERVSERLETSNRLNPLSVGRKYNHSGNDATIIRKCLTEYFNSPFGSVKWQDRYTTRTALTFTNA